MITRRQPEAVRRGAVRLSQTQVMVTVMLQDKEATEIRAAI